MYAQKVFINNMELGRSLDLLHHFLFKTYFLQKKKNSFTGYENLGHLFKQIIINQKNKIINIEECHKHIFDVGTNAN